MAANELKDLIPMTEWLPGIKRPLIIAGPCSAESPEQLMETAKAIKALGQVDIFRAGIWKPRTFPNNFEGVGSIGLEWLREVKKETGLPVATEVGSVKHVFEAIKYGVDLIWIGARTTANPFAMQEIAEALQGVDIPVLVKNPLSPDLELWDGGINRIYAAGIRKLGAIHRGFSTWGKSDLRNTPHWQVPIELKRIHPNLPIIGDPSHICGNRTMIAEIAQRAMDFNLDGLMIESHCNPDEAWSDAKQQVTPTRLGEILSGLKIKTEHTSDEKFIRTLDELRSQIDMYDDQILNILEARMKIAEKIGLCKKENNVSILQTARWSDIINKMIQKGAGKGLSDKCISEIFQSIHEESINHQINVTRD